MRVGKHTCGPPVLYAAKLRGRQLHNLAQGGRGRASIDFPRFIIKSTTTVVWYQIAGTVSQNLRFAGVANVGP
eukprot:3602921-Rhodomonas_salina.2